MDAQIKIKVLMMIVIRMVKHLVALMKLSLLLDIGQFAIIIGNTTLVAL